MKTTRIVERIMLLLAGGCGGVGPGMNDFSYDVADGYGLTRTSAHHIQIHPRKSLSPTDPRIGPKVVDVAWNDRFVLATQHPMKRRSPNDPSDTYEVPDTSTVNYWILDTSVRVLYGPFDKLKFEQKRTSLSVPTEMKLKLVSSYLSTVRH